MTPTCSCPQIFGPAAWAGLLWTQGVLCRSEELREERPERDVWCVLFCRRTRWYTHTQARMHTHMKHIKTCHSLWLLYSCLHHILLQHQSVTVGIKYFIKPFFFSPSQNSEKDINKVVSGFLLVQSYFHQCQRSALLWKVNWKTANINPKHKLIVFF